MRRRERALIEPVPRGRAAALEVVGVERGFAAPGARVTR